MPNNNLNSTVYLNTGNKRQMANT